MNSAILALLHILRQIFPLLVFTTPALIAKPTQAFFFYVVGKVVPLQRKNLVQIAATVAPNIVSTGGNFFAAKVLNQIWG